MRSFQSLSPSACEKLIADGVATGGMQAKLNAATDALRNGISQVIIAPGALERAAERILLGEQIGTRLVAAADDAPALEGALHA